MPIKVQKKDGQLEDFDRNKVFGGVIKSGGTPEEAENVTKQVEVWTQTVAVGGMIKTSEIRTKVLELLRPLNAQVASSFEAYKKVA